MSRSVMEIKTIIKNKYIILDTNILIKALENFSAFESLFIFLKNVDCAIVDFPLIRFEFTRNIFLPGHRESRERFLDILSPSPLPFKEKLIEDSLEIARIYAHQGVQKGQISLVDCCIAAYLKQYKENLFLITLNHKDFPVILFDRLFIFPIDGDNDVFAPAFYKFNDKKWSSLRKKLENVTKSITDEALSQ